MMSPATGSGSVQEPVLSVCDLQTSFPIKSSVLRRTTGMIAAVNSVSLDVQAGEVVAIVGESGCGKSTLARTVCGLEQSHGGKVVFEGTDITSLGGRQRRQVSRHIQMIFQDPYASLNPRRSVAEIISEGWKIHRDLVPRADWDAEVARLLRLVGLDPHDSGRYPHQFSGGQQQRIGIARALALRPRLLVCDEPISALDVSIQADILNLLEDLRKQEGISILLISHDLAVVRAVADRVFVMYLGRIMEEGSTESLFGSPTHPYTHALLSAAPAIETLGDSTRERVMLTGDVPSPAHPPSGCVFRTRCPRADDRCAEEVPDLISRCGVSHRSACHFAEINRDVLPH